VEEVLLLVGHRTGGRAAEFLLKRLSMAVSDDTILRRIKRRARAAMHGEQRLRVVGVDDWAWKKGQTYGTILVDLERRTVADLLPQRSADQLAEWLKQHPEVEVITRDRFGLYAGGARRGAPQARQVADRFHLLLNLREAVKKNSLDNVDDWPYRQWNKKTRASRRPCRCLLPVPVQIQKCKPTRDSWWRSGGGPRRSCLRGSEPCI
jgi:transposase